MRIRQQRAVRVPQPVKSLERHGNAVPLPEMDDSGVLGSSE
jgi:hypothetical protein